MVLIARVRWLEPTFGLDRLSRVHHWNGFAIAALVSMHPVMMSAAYAGLGDVGILQQTLAFARSYPGVLLAEVALLVLLGVWLTALAPIRSRLRYEHWHTLHFVAYAAIGLTAVHQLRIGGDLGIGAPLRPYWLAMWGLGLANVLAFRFIRPLYNTARHDLRVTRLEPETTEVTSVYIGGRNMDRFRYMPGQFVIVRFLQGDMGWEAHPFSLSCVPNGEHIRLSIKAVGDYTRKIGGLKPGTRAIIDGPHGAFTPRAAGGDKMLLIAGGIGITPVRALAEAFVRHGRDVVLLYGNRTVDGIVFARELDALVREHGLVIHHVLSHEPNWSGERGFVDRERIARLVPDAADRDVFLCGPPVMMTLVRKALNELHVPARQVHWERFAL
jgi:predicted ferric reductase